MAKTIIAEQLVKQLQHLLSEISQNADAIAHLACECVEAGDDLESVNRLLVATRSIANQIGWAADLGGGKLGSVLVCKSGAEDWMMPPAYHNAVKAVEVTHV